VRDDGTGGSDSARLTPQNDRPRHVPPEDLVRCDVCGELKGEALIPRHEDEGLLLIQCMCEGVVCGHCGQTRRHRPISTYWKDGEGMWHVPWTEGMHPCDICGKTRWVIWGPTE
jgi:hypothetical protein